MFSSVMKSFVNKFQKACWGIINMEALKFMIPLTNIIQILSMN